MTKPLANPKSKAEAGRMGAAKRKELQAQRSADSETPPASSQKRKTESTGLSTAPASSAKKQRGGMLRDHFLPERNEPSFTPKNLPDLGMCDEDVQIPVVLISKGGETYRLTNDRNPDEECESFWKLAQDCATQLLEIFQDEDFGTMLTGMKSEVNLNLYSAVFPTMFARMSPALAYRKSTKHMRKDEFKTYLNYIIENAELMLNELKDTTIAPALQVQRQEHGEITARLLSAVPGTTISVHEHNEIVRNVVNSTNDMAELTRRELCCYGVAVATAANTTIKNLAQMRTIGTYIRDTLGPVKKAQGEEAHEEAKGKVIKVEGQSSDDEDFFTEDTTLSFTGDDTLSGAEDTHMIGNSRPSPMGPSPFGPDFSTHEEISFGPQGEPIRNRRRGAPRILPEQLQDDTPTSAAFNAPASGAYWQDNAPAPGASNAAAFNAPASGASDTQPWIWTGKHSQDSAPAPGASNTQPSSPPQQPKSADPIPIKTLPLLLVRTLMAEDAHKCRCPEVCEPDLLENLRGQAMDYVRHEKEEEIKNELEHELCDKFRKELEPEALARARKSVQEEVLAKAKDEAAKEERRQLEDQLRTEITATVTAELQASYELRVQAGVKEKLDDMYKRALGTPGTE